MRWSNFTTKTSHIHWGVCVCEREREREYSCACVCVCVCVCVRVCVWYTCNAMLFFHCRAQCSYGISDTLQNLYPFPSLPTKSQLCKIFRTIIIQYKEPVHVHVHVHVHACTCTVCICMVLYKVDLVAPHETWKFSWQNGFSRIPSLALVLWWGWHGYLQGIWISFFRIRFFHSRFSIPLPGWAASVSFYQSPPTWGSWTYHSLLSVG